MNIVLESLAHPEFFSRSVLIAFVMLCVVRTLAVLFNRVLGVPYSRSREVTLLVISIGLLCLVFVSDYAVAAKAAATFIGGSFLTAWLDDPDRRRASKREQGRSGSL